MQHANESRPETERDRLTHPLATHHIGQPAKQQLPDKRADRSSDLDTEVLVSVQRAELWKQPSDSVHQAAAMKINVRVPDTTLLPYA